MAWGPNFNFSIWYLELRGIEDGDLIQRISQNYANVLLFMMFSTGKMKQFDCA